MLGNIETGLVQNRDEVIPSGEGFKGIIVISGQGRWETPEVPTRSAADILLTTLRDKLQPKPKADFSAKQSADFAAALEGIGGA